MFVWPVLVFIYLLAWITISLRVYPDLSEGIEWLTFFTISFFVATFFLILVGLFMESLKRIKVENDTFYIRNFWRTKKIKREQIIRMVIYCKTTGTAMLIPRGKGVNELSIKFVLEHEKSYFLKIRNQAYINSLMVLDMSPLYREAWIFLSQFDIPIEADHYENISDPD